MKRPNGLPAVIAATWAASLLCATSATAWAGGADGVGQPVPEFRALGLDGSDLDLAALRGHVVVINLWATWCPPCRAEMPMLASFAHDHAADGVILVALSADDPHDRKDVSKALSGFTFQAALLQGAAKNGFGLPAALPLTYVVDAQGVIRARLQPTRAGLSRQDLEAAVRPLLPSLLAPADR